MSSAQADRDTPVSGVPDCQPVRCFFLAKGFSRIFWGLVIMLLMFFGNAAVELFHFVKIPAYIVGCAFAAWGLWMLSAAGAVSPKWRRRIRIAMALVCLQVYFAPFLGWWKAAPHVALYFVNVLGLLLVGMLLLFFVNLLAADTFRRLQSRGNRVEALVYAWSVILLLVAPLILLGGVCLQAGVLYKTGFAFEMLQAIGRLPVWSYMVLTIPCSLTLIATWKAKDMCCRRMEQEDASVKP